MTEEPTIPPAVFSVISTEYREVPKTGGRSLMSSTVMEKACVAESPDESVTVTARSS